MRMHQLERTRAGTAAACAIALCHCRAAALLFPSLAPCCATGLAQQGSALAHLDLLQSRHNPSDRSPHDRHAQVVCCCEYCVGPAYRLYFKESAFPPPPPNLGTVVCRTRYSTVVVQYGHHGYCLYCTGTVQYLTVLLCLWYLDLYEYSVVSQGLRAPRAPSGPTCLACASSISISFFRRLILPYAMASRTLGFLPL